MVVVKVNINQKRLTSYCSTPFHSWTLSHWTHELRYLEAIRQTIVNAPEEALQLAQGPARGGLSQELAQKNLEILAENLFKTVVIKSHPPPFLNSLGKLDPHLRQMMRKNLF